MLENTGKTVSNKTTPELRLIKYLHAIVTVVIFALYWLIFRYNGGTFTFSRAARYDLFVAAGYVALLVWFNSFLNSYTLGYFRIRDLCVSQFLAQAFSVAIIYFVVSIGWFHFKAPWVFLVMLVVQALWDVVWSFFANGHYYKIVHEYKTVVLYRTNRELKRFGDITGKPIEKMFNISRYIQYAGNDYFEIAPQLDGFDAIFVAGADAKLTNALAKHCELKNVRGFFMPHIGNILLAGSEHIKSFSSPVLSVRRVAPRMEYLMLKRAFDIVASFCGIVILSPLMLVTALLIKCYDGGPVFYKQIRLTKNEKEFKIIKFRSMRIDAEKDGVARVSTGDKDPRITPVGRFIRACRIDELPQLFNILMGGHVRRRAPSRTPGDRQAVL